MSGDKENEQQLPPPPPPRRRKLPIGERATWKKWKRIKIEDDLDSDNSLAPEYESSRKHKPLCKTSQI